MINLIEAKQALSLKFEELERLEQKLVDSICRQEQNYLVDKVVECEKIIRELEKEIKLLESEE